MHIFTFKVKKPRIVLQKYLNSTTHKLCVYEDKFVQTKPYELPLFENGSILDCEHLFLVSLRWLERVLVFFDALYLGVKIFRLELANHDQILPKNNDDIKVSSFCRFLKKFVAMATQLDFEV